MFGRKFNTQDVNVITTSDLHFYHKGILNFCSDTRPFSDLDDMHHNLIQEWNRLVGEDDYIFHLGDFSFKGGEATAEVLSQLNGKKVMILGNHDKTLRNQFKRGQFGIEEICDYMEIRLDGVKVCMSHFPMVCFNQAGRGSVMLHAHTHGSFQGQGRTVDVGYDNWGRIIHMKEAVDFCLQRPVYSPDQHKIIKE